MLGPYGAPLYRHMFGSPCLSLVCINVPSLGVLPLSLMYRYSQVQTVVCAVDRALLTGAARFVSGAGDEQLARLTRGEEGAGGGGRGRTGPGPFIEQG